ncbi:MAG: RNA methyltransferase [Terriglobales bacterium]
MTRPTSDRTEAAAAPASPGDARPGFRIVLVGTRNPLNIGAAARAMANFGLDDLALVSPYAEAWRQARSARAGAAVLQRAQVFASLPAAIADCGYVIGTAGLAGRNPEIPIADWAALTAHLPPTRCGLVFGSEKTGMSVADIGCCHVLARIDTAPDAPSMNLGQAVAVCAYELHRRRAAPGPPAAPATARWDERDLLARKMTPVLERIGVFRPQHRASQTRRLRQMLLAWRVTPSDVRLLLGVAREMRRVLGLPPNPP